MLNLAVYRIESGLGAVVTKRGKKKNKKYLCKHRSAKVKPTLRDVNGSVRFILRRRGWDGGRRERGGPHRACKLVTGSSFLKVLLFSPIIKNIF